MGRRLSRMLQSKTCRSRQHDEAMKDFDASQESMEKLQAAEKRMNDGEAKFADAVVDSEKRKADGQLWQVSRLISP